MVKKMKKKQYEEIANHHKAPENLWQYVFVSFMSGGFLGLLGEGMIEFFTKYFSFSRSDASALMIVIFIVLASLCTGFGFFDRLTSIFRCGLLIPITGFAHSMTSCALDGKAEGLIYGIGSNLFKLAGSVITYGVLSAWFFGTIRYFIEGMIP